MATFAVVHAVVFPFGWPWASILTTPLHLIFATIAAKSNPARLNRDHWNRSPDCRELVLRKARKCEHCDSALVPQREIEASQSVGLSTTGGFDGRRTPKR